jgi:hypothetical protein
MSDVAVMARLLEKPRACVFQSGSWCERAQRWEIGGPFLELWQVEPQIQQLNVESSYDGVAALVLPLK